MLQSWQRSYYIGNCKYCGAPGYWNFDEEKVWFDNPDEGCICYIDDEPWRHKNETSNIN